MCWKQGFGNVSVLATQVLQYLCYKIVSTSAAANNKTGRRVEQPASKQEEQLWNTLQTTKVTFKLGTYMQWRVYV